MNKFIIEFDHCFWENDAGFIYFLSDNNLGYFTNAYSIKSYTDKNILVFFATGKIAREIEESWSD